MHRTWNRPDAAQLAELYCMVSPNYRAVMETIGKPAAQEVARQCRRNNNLALEVGLVPSRIPATLQKGGTANTLTL